MNEEVHCINNEERMTKDEWENDDLDILLALYSVCKRSGQFFCHTLLADLFKQRYISSVASYKYWNKLISEKLNHSL